MGIRFNQGPDQQLLLAQVQRTGDAKEPEKTEGAGSAEGAAATGGSGSADSTVTYNNPTADFGGGSRREVATNAGSTSGAGSIDRKVTVRSGIGAGVYDPVDLTAFLREWETKARGVDPASAGDVEAIKSGFEAAKGDMLERINTYKEEVMKKRDTIRDTMEILKNQKNNETDPSERKQLEKLINGLSFQVSKLMDEVRDLTRMYNKLSQTHIGAYTLGGEVRYYGVNGPGLDMYM